MFALRRHFGNSLRLRIPGIGDSSRSLHASTAWRAAGHFEISPAKLQIYRIKDMLERVSRTNRPIEKVAIIKEYEDLRPIVEMTYDPHCRYNIKSTSIINHLTRFPDEIGKVESYTSSIPFDEDPVPRFDSLQSLLQALQQGQANTLDVVTYMNRNGIFESARTIEDVERVKQPTESGNLSVLDVFLRVIDKNFKVGFGSRLLKGLGWTPQNDARKAFTDYAKRQGVDVDDVEPDVLCEEFPDAIHIEPALGKTVLREDLPKLFGDPNAPAWFASRKLDGVRCLVLVDVTIEEQEHWPQAQVKVTRTKAYSRTGKAFHTLQPLLDDIKRCIEGWPHVSYLLEGEPSITEEVTDVKWLRGGMVNTKRFVLDGELCVMRKSEEEGGVMIEDFKGVVGKVRRKSGIAEDVRMFLLDFIPWSNFDRSFNGSDDFRPAHKTFDDRHQDVVDVFHRMEEVTLEGEEHSLRYLPQQVISDMTEVDVMIEEAAEEGWEGFILRRDVAYEGKRSSNIRKYKEWLDAEYTVTDVEINTMRLPVDGVYADRQALASVWIEHKGVLVSIGSGFTVMQRLNFAKDPSQIIGKQITVEYFGESTSDARDKKGGGLSLRFPRIKHIWEDGKRDV